MPTTHWHWEAISTNKPVKLTRENLLLLFELTFEGLLKWPSPIWMDPLSAVAHFVKTANVLCMPAYISIIYPSTLRSNNGKRGFVFVIHLRTSVSIHRSTPRPHVTCRMYAVLNLANTYQRINQYTMINDNWPWLTYIRTPKHQQFCSLYFFQVLVYCSLMEYAWAWLSGHWPRETIVSPAPEPFLFPTAREPVPNCSTHRDRDLSNGTLFSSFVRVSDALLYHNNI